MKRSEILANAKGVVLAVLVAIQLALFGCAPWGWLVSADQRILFADQATGRGTFSEGDVSVDYSLSLHGKEITVAGKVDHRSAVNFLNLYLLLIDAAGNVLQQRIVYSTGYRVYRDGDGDRTFRETLAVPVGTMGISFGYSSQPRTMQR
jgi:hypothetical protein